MSYDSVVAKKKSTTEESEPLIPDELKQANQTIESDLSKLMLALRVLGQKKNELGTGNDNQDLRTQINAKMQEGNTLTKSIQKQVDDYEHIGVNYKSQDEKEQKRQAFSARFKELLVRFQEECGQIQTKMKQFIDLAERQRKSSINDLEGEKQRTESEYMKQQLDQVELKVGAEADYMTDVIQQRQEDLNNVEKLMSDINQIAQSINTNVHNQRHDLVQIDQHATEAKDNAEEAHKQIVQAQDSQKKGGKCMYYILGAIALFVFIIIIIFIITFAGSDDEKPEPDPSSQ